MIDFTLLLALAALLSSGGIPGEDWHITETISGLELIYTLGAAVAFALRLFLLAGSITALRDAHGAAVLKLVAWINVVGDIARGVVQIGFLILGGLSMLVPPNPYATFVATLLGWTFTLIETYLVINAIIDWHLRARLLQHTRTYVLLEQCIDPECKHPAHKDGQSHTGPSHKEA